VEPLARVTACHCSQCRKQTGHHWASGQAEAEGFDIQGEVRWFEASKHAKRGFWGTCGSFLFWKGHDETTMSFSLCAIDGLTGVRISEHIFTANKGDYYDIADGVPQREQ
jgi:hypothetical protein